MARKEFETVVAQASRESLVRYTNEVNTPVPASTGFEEILIYAGPNQVGKIINVMVLAPAITGSPVGNHEIWMSYNIPNSVLHVSTNMDMAYGQSSGSNPIQYQFGYWYVASGNKYPVDNAAQGNNIRGAEFDNTVAFRISYINYSNVAQTGTRKYYLTYTQREVRA